MAIVKKCLFQNPNFNSAFKFADVLTPDLKLNFCKKKLKIT